jgi:hypothetical protein
MFHPGKFLVVLGLWAWLCQADAADLTPLPYSFVVDGKAWEAGPALQLYQAGEVFLLPFATIAQHYEDEYEVSDGVLWVQRSQDSALFSLRFKDGEVTANRRPVGYAPGMAAADAANLLLPVAAVEALTGTHIEVDPAQQQVRIELDKRLKPILDFQILVDGRLLPTTDPQPRAVGHVLLLPLRPIAAELGGQLQLDPIKQTVTVRRAQDNALIELELLSGLVKANKIAVGVTPDMNYANPLQLLLPKAAVEALTGSHIELLQGTNQIHVRLDERLKEIISPSGAVLEQAENEPFVAESLNFKVGNDTVNEFEFRSHYREYNSKLRYELSNYPEDNVDTLEPSWLQWQVDSLRGYSVTAGDYNTARREMQGTGVSRLRGGTYAQPFEAGDMVLLAGQPSAGTRRLSNGASVQDYDGLALGGRFYSRHDDWEAGLSGRRNDGRAMLAANFQDRKRDPASWLGAADYYYKVNLGYFEAATDEREPDWEGQWDAHFKTTDKLSLAANLHYTGEKFAYVNQADPVVAVDPLNPFIPPAPLNPALPITLLPADQLQWGGNASYRLFDNLSVAARYSADQRERRAGPDMLASYGGSLSAQIFDTGASLLLDYSRAETEDRGQLEISQTSLNYDLAGFRLYAQYRAENDALGDRETFNAQISAPAYDWSYPLGPGRLSITPSIYLNSQGEDLNSSLGGSVVYKSYPLLDSSLDFELSYNRYEAFAVVESNDDSSPQSSGDLFTASLNYRVSRSFLLELRYYTDFQNEGNVYVTLKGNLDFNPPRQYKGLLPGRGILSGLVYLDRNRDRQRQEEEQGLPGVLVQLKRTPLKLRTNRQGEFTIQNLPPRTYDVTIKQESLPIGLLPAQEQLPAALVKEGEITKLQIPILASGQLRGRVFLDQNRDGKRDPGEEDLEGLRLTVSPGDAEAFTASFGQFALERLQAGRYELRFDPAFLPQGIPPPEPVIVELKPEQMMMKVEIGLRGR